MAWCSRCRPRIGPGGAARPRSGRRCAARQGSVAAPEDNLAATLDLLIAKTLGVPPVRDACPVARWVLVKGSRSASSLPGREVVSQDGVQGVDGVDQSIGRVGRGAVCRRRLTGQLGLELTEIRGRGCRL